MDGRLRRIKRDHWQGTLAGFVVTVFHFCGQWHYAVSRIDRPRNTLICKEANSRDEAAKNARQWIEQQIKTEAEAPAPPQQ